MNPEPADRESAAPSFEVPGLDESLAASVFDELKRVAAYAIAQAIKRHRNESIAGWVMDKEEDNRPRGNIPPGRISCYTRRMAGRRLATVQVGVALDLGGAGSEPTLSPPWTEPGPSR
ncbi:hypothetical protein GCM10009839_17560 [Catenulispora yoronensis]|uniref:Uncharacterized protein n=1 Tax=Catenulispora yoronensis TaxID=450799 RepID=A0ABP5F977_9ACTN